MNLYIMNKKPTLKWHAGLIGVIGASSVVTLVVLGMFIPVPWTFEAFILGLSFLFCCLVAWDFFIQSPFRCIETPLNAAQADAWLRFGASCGTNPAGAFQALTAFRKAQKQLRMRDAEPVAQQVRQAQENGDASRAVI